MHASTHSITIIHNNTNSTRSTTQTQEARTHAEKAAALKTQLDTMQLQLVAATVTNDQQQETIVALESQLQAAITAQEVYLYVGVWCGCVWVFRGLCGCICGCIGWLNEAFLCIIRGDVAYCVCVWMHASTGVYILKPYPTQDIPQELLPSPFTGSNSNHIPAAHPSRHTHPTAV